MKKEIKLKKFTSFPLKFDLKMKITTLFMIVFLFQLQAKESYAQKTKISIKLENVSFENVLNEIESLTEFKFLFNYDEFDYEKTVSIHAKKERISSILKWLFKDSNMSFKVIDKQIVLSRNQNSTLKIEPTDHSSVRQEFTVNGTVSDSNGQPLPGANVLEKGTTNGTQTDFDGKFLLTVQNSNSILIVSYLGFETKEIPVQGRSQIKIQLEEDSANLDEVVIVGYGSVAKKDLTGAVTVVKNITNRAVTNTEEALQGNAAGVTVTSAGGDPTGVPRVRIRGVGSTSDESPLWIVDGVPYYGGPLNPFDIETLTVLKDASSTAIYGVRAAGGVIVVTTKKGKSGDLVFDFNSFTGTQSVWNKPKALNAAQHAEFQNLADDNSGTPRESLLDGNLNPENLISKTNWVNEIFRSGLIQNYDLGIRGGTDKYRFASSIGFNKKEGTLLNTEASRISFRINSDLKVNDKLKIGENISYTRTKGNSAFTGTQDADGEAAYIGVISQAIKAPTHISIYDENGGYTNMPDAAGFGFTIHPVATLNRIDVENIQEDLFGNIYLDYTILDGLNFKSSFGVNFKKGSFKEFSPRVPEVARNQTSANSLQVANSTQTDLSLENTITYNTKISDKHDLKFLGGYTLQSFSRKATSILGKNFPNEADNLRELVNATEFDKPLSITDENSLVSYFGRLNYSFNDKYLLTASIRRDGTSRLSSENRWGTFPSAAFAWKLSEENFLKDSKTFNSVKLRTSWGRIGNISSLSSYPTDVPLAVTRSVLNTSSFVNGFAEDGISNPDIKWETSEQANIGLDMSLLDRKINFTVDYFIKDTKDLILRLPVSSLVGVQNEPFVNAGNVRNKGVELTLSYQKNEGDFTYNISGNISKIKNELVSLGNGITEIGDLTQVGTHFPIQSTIGQPLFSFYLIETDGIFQSDAEATAYTAQPNAVAGDLKFKDNNNDGVISDLDSRYKGSAFPDFTYALNGNFNYKNFDLSLFFQGVTGSKAYNGFKLTTVYPAQSSVAYANLSADAIDTWHPGNTGSSNFRLSRTDPNDNIRKSDFWLEDTSYLRLKNITIGYTFSKIKSIDRLRIYTTGQNVFTITDYSGLDPEVANRGIDGGQYPVSRVFTLGLNLSF